MDLHDLWGQQLGQPLYRLLGLNPASIAPTSLTIVIDEPARMAERAAAACAPILKIKLGADADEARIQAIRVACASQLRVDANGGWDLARAAQLLPWLAEQGVELVEQPLPVGDLEGLRALRRLSPRPLLFVDESIKTPADIGAHAGIADGIVVKLAKAGGLRAVQRQIAVARALDLRVMLSCMVETSVAVTAAAQLAPLVDLVDLDGPLLIENDPFVGIRYEGARIILPAGPGLGLRQRQHPV
jgi:L-alanine-DL-glutamate epimerase-like enolase superfamily enzyme